MKALFSMWDEGNLWTAGRVVAALGTRGRSASWEVIDDPSNDYGGDSRVLEGWARNGTRVTGSRMVTAASGSQLIEGEIRGFISCRRLDSVDRATRR
jgi:hypothetical protein